MFRGVVIVIVMAMLVGCAHSQQGPVTPRLDVGSSALCAGSNDDPHRLWGEWTLFIPQSHDRVDLVPQRGGRFHLNALKFLEEYCTNCLEITKIKNNGDGTIDLTVKITHPFPGFPQYTGFDVKGIIMFNGSFKVWDYEPDQLYYYGLPNPTHVSWRELGDPEVLNADGYTPRWSLSWNSGSDMPIYRYWEGKYASGVPNGDLNAYLDFYTHEERHMFDCMGAVERTYTIWLPPGEDVVAGYAVDACWELPLKTPVTDPAQDFPLTANQPEPYYLRYIINNGEPITDCETFEMQNYDCAYTRVELKQWGSIDWWSTWFTMPDGKMGSHGILQPCEPPQDSVFEFQDGPCYEGQGNGRYLTVLCVTDEQPLPDKVLAYTLCDYVIDEPD